MDSISDKQRPLQPQRQVKLPFIIFDYFSKINNNLIAYKTLATTSAPLSFGLPQATQAATSFGLGNAPASSAPLSFGTPTVTGGLKSAPLTFGAPAPSAGNIQVPVYLTLYSLLTLVFLIL